MKPKRIDWSFVIVLITVIVVDYYYLSEKMPSFIVSANKTYVKLFRTCPDEQTEAKCAAECGTLVPNFHKEERFSYCYCCTPQDDGQLGCPPNFAFKADRIMCTISRPKKLKLG